MNLFESTLSNIEQKAEIKKAGGFNGIPYPYPRLSEFVPSIDKESVIGITSFTGAAKSKFLRYTFIMYPYEFSLVNNYDVLIDYYALEDSAMKVYKNILCHHLNAKYNIKISTFDLDSKFKALSSDVIAHIKDAEKYMQDFASKVRIKDGFTRPYAIYQDVIKTAAENGEIITKDVDFGDGKIHKQIVDYIPHNKGLHWLLACDNLNNIDKEKHHSDKKDAMDSFVQRDCRLIYSKIFKMTCIIIHQQALEAERQQFTNTGGSIIEKIKPSMANLGGTKEVTRSYHLLFSLFNPHKFKIENYRGYNIGHIANNFRELEVIKSNEGFDNVSVPLYFDGASEIFWEIPHAEKQKEELQKFYDWLTRERLSQKNKSLLF
jgi:hypothetical protein